MGELFTVENGIALLTLTGLEVVLGIDNLVFISIITAKLPAEHRTKAARIGIAAAVLTRIALLFTITLIVQATTPVIDLTRWGVGVSLSIKDLVLIGGGLFLIWKATHEMHAKLKHGLRPLAPTGAPEGAVGVIDAGAVPVAAAQAAAKGFAAVIVQIMLIDIVFSIDSVITAVGMTQNRTIMVIAVMLSAGIMVAAAKPVMQFVEKFPTIKILALAFLLLIGVMIVAEGFHQKIPKGYIYFAMAFSLGVEALQMFAERRQEKRREQRLG
ncbi:TerC family protein [soil metagenome]